VYNRIQFGFSEMSAPLPPAPAACTPQPASSQYASFQQSVLRLGDKAPNFSAETSTGQIDFYNWLGSSWGVLFSHPADFTPVCTTELGRLSALTPEFEKRNVKVIALSVDTVEHHQQWIADINDVNGCNLKYPIISDADRKISCAYGMLDQNYLDNKGMPATVRSVFVIDPARVVRLIISYPASTGRNFAEILRVIDSLQLAGTHKVATPADWERGKETVVLPSVPTDEAHKLFPRGVKVIRPWLRTTPDPSV